MVKFPLNQDQVNTFQSLKQELASAAMQAINENIPFTVGTDASDFAIPATWNQDRRPLALHSINFPFFYIYKSSSSE